MRSIVVPIFMSESNIPDLLTAIEAMASRAPAGLEAIFVVDGSPDRSEHLLRQELPRYSWPSQLVILSRNFGAFAAVRCGLSTATGSSLAVMAADLQEPPELIETMFEKVESGAADVAIGKRTGRHDPLASVLFSRTYWWLYRKFVQPDMPEGGMDVFCCNQQVSRALLDLGEHNSSLVGLLVWLGFDRAEVPYVRRERKHGKSSWSFSKRFRYLVDSIFSFTDLPLRALTFIGLLGILLSIFLGVAILVVRIRGQVNVPGYAATILTMLFFSALNLLSLGILGSYLWRAFENTKSRNLYVVKDRLRYRSAATPLPEAVGP